MKKIMCLLAIIALFSATSNAQVLQQDYMNVEDNIVLLPVGQQVTVSLDSVPSFDTGYVNVYLYRYDSLYNGYVAVPCYANNGTAILTEFGRYKYKVIHYIIINRDNGNSFVRSTLLNTIKFKVRQYGMNQKENKDIEINLNQDKE